MSFYNNFWDKPNQVYTPTLPETHVIHQINDWGYGFFSRHIPYSSYAPVATIGGVTATFVTTVPTQGQIRVWYTDENKMGWWECNASDLNKTVQITDYRGQGSALPAEFLNEITTQVNTIDNRVVNLENAGSANLLPSITSITPSSNQYGVSITTPVTLIFNQNMLGDDLLSNFTLTDNVTPPNNIPGSITLFDRAGSSVSSSATNIRKMVFTPTSSLTITSSYNVVLNPCENIIGIKMPSIYKSSFSYANMVATPDSSHISITNVTKSSYTVTLPTAYQPTTSGETTTFDIAQGNTSNIVVSGVSGTEMNTGKKITSSSVAGTTSTIYVRAVSSVSGSGSWSSGNSVIFPSDVQPSAPVAANITVSSISSTGYTVTLLTANQPNDPDDLNATITFDIADGSISNIIATGISAAAMNSGYAVLQNNTAGTNKTLYVRAVSSTDSTPGAWSSGVVFTVTVPVVFADTFTAANGTAPDSTKWRVNPIQSSSNAGSGTGITIQNNQLDVAVATTDTNIWVELGAVTVNPITLGSQKIIKFDLVNATSEAGTSYSLQSLFTIAGSQWTTKPQDLTSNYIWFNLDTLGGGEFQIQGKNVTQPTVSNNTNLSGKTVTFTLTLTPTTLSITRSDNGGAAVTVLSNWNHGQTLTNLYLGPHVMCKSTSPGHWYFDNIQIT